VFVSFYISDRPLLNNVIAAKHSSALTFYGHHQVNVPNESDQIISRRTTDVQKEWLIHTNPSDRKMAEEYCDFSQRRIFG
jgi:hypothetical protein